MTSFVRMGVTIIGGLLVTAVLGCAEQSDPPEASAEIAQGTEALSTKTIVVTAQIEVTAPASAVWETVGNFNGWDKFLTVVESSSMSGQGVGSVRFLSVTGQKAPVVEREDVYDPRHRIIAYTILDSPLPVDDYHSMMRVVPVTDEITRVEWSSRFVAKKGSTREQAKAFITDFYAKGLADLQSLMTPKVVREKYIPVPPSAVWAIVSDFNGLGQFVTDVANSRLVTSGKETFRILDFKDGVTQVIERLDSSDDASTTVTYSIVAAPLPFENYTSTIQVKPQGSGSLVSWSGRYNPVGDPTDAVSFLDGLYTSGLQNLYDQLAH
ncbi:MAG: SRPBCC family protein [Polyangiaceae bacterium]